MSKVDQIDTNINNYTYAELLFLLGLDDYEATDPKFITQAANNYITRYQKSGNKQLIQFFEEIRDKLINYANDIEEGNSDNVGPNAEQTKRWIKDAGGLPQEDKVQKEKITDRFQKIDVYGNPYVPMEREQLGINNTHEVSVAQDGKLNPTLKNTTQRMVVLDSFYRQESASGNISTDYTLDLSDRLTDVLSMRVYSVQIPLTYYNIDDVYGNTCFWITDGSNNVPISISPGNYNSSTLVAAISQALTHAGFFFTSPPVTYDSVTYKITLNLDGGVYTPPPGSPYTAFVISNFSEITFFNVDKTLICNDTCIPQALHINETLGYIMGFQSPSGVYDVNPDGNVADSVVDLFGPRYLILVVDDFTQNHLNSGMVTITEPSKIVKLPSYYTTDHPYLCEDDSGNLVPQLIQSGPRTLTQNQLYTINEIIKNNVNNLDTRAKAPTTTNVLAIIPIKQTTPGTMYVDFSGPIQENIRTYFGPVDIERMRIRLLDDKGNTLNLNGANFSITLLCELLYQY